MSQELWQRFIVLHIKLLAQMEIVNESVTYGKPLQALLKDSELTFNINLPFCKQPFTGHLASSVE